MFIDNTNLYETGSEMENIRHVVSKLHQLNYGKKARDFKDEYCEFLKSE